jgi:heme/copper-type cytochrome/quinol oxidase subunit 3
MSLPVRFSGDLAELPTHAYGHRSLTWWGIIAFFAIEGTGFALAIGAYFYIMGGEQTWPPQPYLPPNPIAGTIFTILLLLSEIPNTLAKRAAEKKDLRALQKYLLIVCAMCVLMIVPRAFEFNSLNVSWKDNAYGSIIWTLLFLHVTHYLTDFADTLVLTGLMFTRHSAENRRYVDAAENAMYWRFVWVCWLPIYVLIYWLPRWMS